VPTDTAILIKRIDVTEISAIDINSLSERISTLLSVRTLPAF